MPHRRKPGHLWMLLILPLLMTGLLALPAEAKSWEIPNATINLRLDSDGSLLVTEQRTFSFEGEQVRQGWLKQKRDLAKAELEPAQVGLALAMGLSLKRMLDPTSEIGNQFAWLLATDMVIDSPDGGFGGAGAGAAGGNGGGGAS